MILVALHFRVENHAMVAFPAAAMNLEATIVFS